ncbi:Biotin holocarboxylase synthetase/biotin-protein ligase [Trachipleistophora hominis]|uniref:Biotin holocarboxylase synthetase/biotin-protein ligase n=1 Tax=Trachipleistophora hominis TaxID=72359 RepID=L7JYN8_TRAHO|nr:Biotin holocarboxylase synthetase/biotin-protein ligase [Trachipleistophora hominis]
MKIKWFKTISSTQKHLINSTSTYKDTYPVIATMHQTRGVGRTNSTWQSLIHTLSFSYVTHAHVAYIDVIGRVRHVLVDQGVDALCKWPNDVLVRNGETYHKVCGALIDVIGEYAVVGVGVNLGYTCTCTIGCDKCTGISMDEWCTEDNKEATCDGQYSGNIANYKTLRDVTGVEVTPLQFFEHYFTAADRFYTYDWRDRYVNYRGERMEIIDKRELRLKDRNGNIHLIDPMVCSYDYHSNSIVGK